MPTLLFLGGIGFAAWFFLRKKAPAQTAYAFNVYFHSPAALPDTDAAISEMLQKLGLDPSTIFHSSIYSGVPGNSTDLMVVLTFVTKLGAPMPHLPAEGTALSVMGVPLTILSIEPITPPS